MALSDLACRQAQPKPKYFKMPDSGGLYLEVRPTGNKIWRVKYRFNDIERTITHGTYPIISLVQAREYRDKIKAQIILGIDPIAEFEERKQLARYKNAQTFQLVAEQWHQRYLSTWTERYGKEIFNRLKANVFPCFGSKPISEVTITDIMNCLEKIEERKAYDLTRRILRIIGQIMRYGVQTSRCVRDITPDLKGALIKYNTGHYACIETDEIKGLVNAIYSNEARLYPQTIYALKLIMHTFVRTNELINAKWNEFDFDKMLWTIPAERMKMKKAHLVPLSKQVGSLLCKMKELYGYQEYILPSISCKGKPISNNTILSALAALKYEKKMTGHGFRSLAMSSIKENFAYRHEVIDRQLAHVPNNKVDKAYDRAKFLDDRKAMMQDWSDFIDKQLL
ncbi:tyrosine-type recombinase/integrase [Pedobacter sp. KACC 23697]|uniref:Integrase arm-type DNA-binding domain-containing protein n=1 Tax=Pedobacter sp. KACC 23697 TaxID=3149230 RepID=A0AAU7K6A1_9SPHI